MIGIVSMKVDIFGRRFCAFLVQFAFNVGTSTQFQLVRSTQVLRNKIQLWNHQ